MDTAPPLLELDGPVPSVKDPLSSTALPLSTTTSPLFWLLSAELTATLSELPLTLPPETTYTEPTPVLLLLPAMPPESITKPAVTESCTKNKLATKFVSNRSGCD